MKISNKIMKSLNFKGIILLLLLFTSTYISAQTSDAVLGTWLNDTKEAKIEIFKNGNKYFGKIIWLKIPNDANGQAKTDTHNSDSKLKLRKILGLQIIQNFDYAGGNLWDNGKIYDPKNGKTYSCKMTLIDKNNLEVRGFIGISILGRTTTWTRSN